MKKNTKKQTLVFLMLLSAIIMASCIGGIFDDPKNYWCYLFAIISGLGIGYNGSALGRLHKPIEFVEPNPRVPEAPTEVLVPEPRTYHPTEGFSAIDAVVDTTEDKPDTSDSSVLPSSPLPYRGNLPDKEEIGTHTTIVAAEVPADTPNPMYAVELTEVPTEAAPPVAPHLDQTHPNYDHAAGRIIYK